MAEANLVELTAAITAAFVSNNRVEPSAVPHVISSVHTALAQTAGEGGETVGSETPALTRTQIRKSIGRDALISFEDGKPYRALRRHLTVRGLTPDQYREKWGLGSDYPMVAASYSEARSELAKAAGLGQRRTTAKSKTTAKPKTTSAPAKRGPGRPRKNT